MVRDEIKKLFSYGDIDAAYFINGIDVLYPAYVVRKIGCFGVAVPYDGEEIRESFANAEICKGEMAIEGNTVSCIFLLSSIEITRNEFAVFCEDFVDPGIDGERRKRLLANPFEWWKEWRLLIGNAITEKRTYAVLAELLVYKYLLKQGKSVKWSGPNGSSHDLVCTDEEYEVKSTISRYDKLIHIAGQFQLQTDKPLNLAFLRFEKNNNGICIDDIVDGLVADFGEIREDIEGKLNMQGYGIGTSARHERYLLHEALEYKVDNSFPKIIPQSFVDGNVPKGVEHIEYDVNLDVLDAVKMEI